MRRFALTIMYLSVGTVLLAKAQGGTSELYEAIVHFQQDEWALSRKYNVRESKEYYDRFFRLYREWLEKLEKLPFNELSQSGKADYIMLKNLIAKNNYFLKVEYEDFERISHTLTVASPLYEFIKLRRYGGIPEYRNLAKTFQEIAGELIRQQEVLKDKPFENRVLADKAGSAIRSLRKGIKEAYTFYFGYDPLFTWWMEKPYAVLDSSLDRYSAFLAENFKVASQKGDGSGIIGRPIGEEAIQKSLEFSMIPYQADELIEAAEKQFQYCEQEMLKAAGELGFGKDWKAALEYVKNTYVPAGGQPKLIDSLAWEAIDFIESRDLVTVPELAKETWRMKMMTPERQKINPFFTGGEVISISYPANTMQHEDKMMSMRGNNPNFSTATVHHELIPGHHLQQFMTSRYKPYRKAFSTPFWTEGWALYWEINLWNKGFADTPEERIGMLFWRMHRCARIIFSLGYHLGKLTPQQCINLLVDRVGHEYANAEAEVRRSFTAGYDPLYQIAYMVGGLQFFALQKEMTGMGWTEKNYHDAVLREGNIPVEMLRKILKKEDINDKFRTSWRFSMGFK